MIHPATLTRRTALALIAGGAISPFTVAWGATEPLVTVHKGAYCGCCNGWIRHLQDSGFSVKAFDTANLDGVKARLGVPADLASCHTAEVASYVIEGHVPATAIKRLLAEKPIGSGLAVPDMPIGSPGMEGKNPELYAVILFGPAGRRSYMRFRGDRAYPG